MGALIRARDWESSPLSPPERYQPIRGADGVVSGIFVEGSDVTDRAEADAARREGDARLGEVAAINQDEAQFRLLVKGVTDYAI